MSKCDLCYSTSVHCTVASPGIEGKGKFTQHICTHVILSNLIAQMRSKRNKQMKELVKMMQQLNMIKLVIMRLRSVLGSWENLSSS